jgi:hypothetical protein
MTKEFVLSEKIKKGYFEDEMGSETKWFALEDVKGFIKRLEEKETDDLEYIEHHKECKITFQSLADYIKQSQIFRNKLAGLKLSGGF